MFPVIFPPHTHFTLAKVQLLSKNKDVSPGKRRDLSDDSGFFNMLFSLICYLGAALLFYLKLKCSLKKLIARNLINVEWYIS